MAKKGQVFNNVASKCTEIKKNEKKVLTRGEVCGKLI